MRRILLLFFLIYSLSGLYSQSSSILDSIIGLDKNTNKLTSNYLRELADSLRRKGHYEDAIDFYTKSVSYTTPTKKKYDQACAYIGLGRTYSDYQEFRTSINYFKKSLPILNEVKDTQLIVQNLVGIASTYFHLEKEDSTIAYMQEALKYAKKDEKLYSSYLHTIYNALGLSYNDKFDFPKSLNSFYKAIAICEKYNDKEGMAITYNNLGNLYMDLGNKEQGFQYYKKALKYELRGTNALANLAHYYFSSEKYDSALFYINRCLDVDIRNNDRTANAANYIVKANIYKVKNQLDSALFYYYSSIKISQEIGDISAIENSTFNIVELFIEQAKYEKAKPYAHKNLESLLNGSDYGFIADTYGQLVEIYSKTGNYSKAFEYQQKLILYKDSALAANKDLEIKKIELTAEYQKKSSNDSLTHAHETLLNNLSHESEINKQRLVLFGFIFILIIVAVFSVWVYRRYKISQRQKEIINLQKNEMYNQKMIVEEKQKEILDSIHYAKRIQYALIAHKDFLDEHLPENFVYFNPKDIVSGDFYWATKNEDYFYLAICDSTGHGVPGAFMSLLNIGFLSEAINEKGILEPNKVFDFVRMRLENSISKEGQKDGFDGILLRYDLKTKKMDYSAANNAPVLISDGTFIELPKDRMPVGVGERKNDFSLYTIDAKSGDKLYFYTDGFADQFGGPQGKKYKYRKLNDLLISNTNKPLNEFTEFLSNEFKEWRGELEQVDDVCIIGLKV